MKGLIKRLGVGALIALTLCSCSANPPADTTAQTDPAEETTAADTTEEVIPLTTIDNGMMFNNSYYTNNLTDGTADPFILKHGDTYYLYCTGGSQYKVRTSKDLVHWTVQSTPILKLSDTGWAKEKGWAPEMYEYNGKFYFIFSAKGEKYHSIDIAVCDTPNGVFKTLNHGKPFFSPNFSVIDASLFFDDDGRIYFYYSKDCSTNIVNGKKTSQTWGVEVKPDFSGIIGEPILISTPEYDWELKSGNTLWNEGPVVFKQNGTYYLLYSANYYVSQYYSVGYATSDTPLRFFDKTKDSRILSGNGDTVTGPGHCNILRSPDGTEIYVVYHVHTVPPNTDKGRSLAIDRLVVREDGTLAVDGPSEVKRPLPSGANGYFHLNGGFTYVGSGEKAEFASKSDIKYLFDGIANSRLTDIYSLDEGGYVEIKTDKPENIVSVWVYPSSYEGYRPDSVDVIINGQYVIEGLKFRGDAGNPVVANLRYLPEGTLVESIKIVAHLADGNDYAAFSEIIMVTK